MKLHKVQKGKYVFELARLEPQVLCALLERYPVIPPDHFRLSGTSTKRLAEHQKLLGEFMAAHREENQREVQAFLAAKKRFKTTKTGIHLTLDSEDVEMLLQVLNDIRVGSWIALGSPDQYRYQQAELNEVTTPYFWAIEMAAQFQMALVEAKGRPSPEHPPDDEQ